MIPEIINKQDFLLELLLCTNEIEGRTKLQKIVFLAQEELSLPHVFDFNTHHFGPYSPELTDILHEMIFMGQINEDIEVCGENIIYRYRVSKYATLPTERIISEKTKDILKRLAKVHKDEIIGYVYRKYLPHKV
jgi:uncharacterized protein